MTAMTDELAAAIRRMDAEVDPQKKAAMFEVLFRQAPVIMERLYGEDWDEESQTFEPEWFPMPEDLRIEE